MGRLLSPFGLCGRGLPGLAVALPLALIVELMSLGCGSSGSNSASDPVLASDRANHQSNGTPHSPGHHGHHPHGDRVLAEMAYALQGGQKMLRTQWDGITLTGSIRMGLRFKDPAQSRESQGYDLSRAASTALIKPAPGAACDLRASGVIQSAPNVSTIDFEFKGKDCGAEIEAIARAPALQLEFRKIAGEGQTAGVSELVLRID